MRRISRCFMTRLNLAGTMMLRLACLLVPLVVLATPAQAATIRVEGSCGIRNAIRAANSDQANDFCPAGNGHDTIVLTWDVALTSELPKITSAITIEGGGHFISGQDKYRIFFVDEDGDLTIKNLTLKDGHARDGGLECRPSDNSEDWDGWDETGGAICNLGELAVIGSGFSGHSAKYSGGAIFNNEARARISGSGFSSNSAVESLGGAIYNNESTVSVSHSSFSRNSAGGGGAIYGHATATSISISSFSGNSAIFGGAIFIDEREARISDSSFSDNTAYEGGAIYNVWGEASISGSSFRGNSAQDYGGAIWALTGRVGISNSTITGNSAAESGGISVGVGDEFKATVTLRDSIIADNDGGDCEILQGSTLKASSSNYIQDGSCKATWSGSDARESDGYCPASQLKNGVCQIGAEAASSAASPSQPSDAPVEQPAQSETQPGAITVGGDCTLADAITASNRKGAYGGCPAGEGVIQLSGDIRLSNTLPDINADIVIEGARHTISGAGEYEILRVNAQASLTINNLTLADGQVGIDHEPWTRAGALTNKGMTTINNSRFVNNSGTTASAINNRLGATLVINSSSFSGNQAHDDGAAIANDRGRMRITNSTLTGNFGGFAVSVGAPDDYVVITNSAIVKNSGGASFLNGSATLRNSILADNRRGDCRGSLHEESRNIIQDGSCDAGAAIDPLLGRLIEPTNNAPIYYRLTGASPGLDVADASACPTVDALGVERPQGSGCDIGPVEYRGIEPTPWALGHSSQGAMSIEDLACTADQTWFVLALRRAELGRAAGFKVTLEAVDGASLAHVMPVPVVRSGWEFAQEIAVDVAMYGANLAAAELYTKIPGSSLVVSGATKVSALVQKYHEWDAEQEKLERQSLGMFRATMFADSSDIDFLVHASHADGGALRVISDWWDYGAGAFTREFVRVAPCQ